MVSRLELLFLALCIILGSFLRLYHLEQTAMFLGDQGRDAIIVNNILKNGDIALIGPVTSVGNMYLGPFYYYFMVPWLALTYPNPIGPAIGVAIVGIITIPLLYFIIRRLFSQVPAMFAAGLFSVSAIAVDQVRFSWNPNLAPTVGLLIFYYLYKLVVRKKSNSIVWLAVWFAVVIQLHYLALLLGGCIVLAVISAFVRQPKSRRSIIGYSLTGILLFALSLAPLIIFDRRHDHLILNGFVNFFNSPEDHLLPIQKIGTSLIHVTGSFYKILPGMVGSTQQSTHQALSLLIIGVGLWVYKLSSKAVKSGLRMYLLWFGVAILAMSFYSSSIFIHYLSFSQAVSISFFGVLLGLAYLSGRPQIKWLTVAVIAIFIMYNIRFSPAFIPGQKHLQTAKNVADTIYQRVKPNEKYNIVLISGTGDIDAQNYRYFLETTDRPPVPTDRRGEVETLFIIQEDYFDTKVVDSPIYEIVVFPDKTPKEVYKVDQSPIITILKKSV